MSALNSLYGGDGHSPAARTVGECHLQTLAEVPPTQIVTHVKVTCGCDRLEIPVNKQTKCGGREQVTG